MAQELKFRRGTTAQTDVFTGAEAEFTYDTQKKAIVTHDGSTIGGFTGGGFLQAGTGAEPRSVESKLRETVSVKDFGAVGNGIVDDTDAIKAAAEYATANNAFLTGPEGTYLVTDTIQLDSDGNMELMTIEADGASVSPVVRFGTITGQPTVFKRMVLPRVTNNSRTAGVWGNGIGIELANCNTCEFTVPFVTQFETGLQCGGYTSGFAYNTLNLMYIYSNKINLKLTVSGTGGWCNQNVFMGGRLGFNTSDFTVSGYSGTRFIVMEKGVATSAGPNNNLFLNTSIESSLVDYRVEFNESASYNQLINCRWEGSSKRILFHTDTASGITGNIILGGYNAGVAPDFTGTGSSLYNSVFAGRVNKIESTGSNFDLVNKSSNSVTAPHIQGFQATETAMSKSSADTDWTYRLYAHGFDGKRDTDTDPRLRLDFQNARITFGTGATPSTNYFESFSTLGIRVSSRFQPANDNIQPLGFGGYRWSEVFAGNGTINTSDGNEKQDVEAISAAELRVATAIKGSIKKFKFKDAVASKGDDARIHFGVIAQDVQAAFEAEGLDPERYGLFCKDTWYEIDGEFVAPNEDGSYPEGAVERIRYGIRYDQLLSFVIASM